MGMTDVRRGDRGHPQTISHTIPPLLMGQRTHRCSFFFAWVVPLSHPHELTVGQNKAHRISRRTCSMYVLASLRHPATALRSDRIRSRYNGGAWGRREKRGG